MHVEGIAFYTLHGKPGYVPVSFSDEAPGAAHGVPVAVVRGERVTGEHQALAATVLRAHAAQGEGKVGVYVGPHTTDLEITFLWIAGFRARKVRGCEVVAARGRWQVAAWRHYVQVAGLAKRSLQVEGGHGRSHGVPCPAWQRTPAGNAPPPGPQRVTPPGPKSLGVVPGLHTVAINPVP